MSQLPPESPRPSVTPPTFASPLAQPIVAAGATIPPPPPALPALPPLPELSRRGRSVRVWWFAILAVPLILLAAYFLQFIGPTASIVGFILAAVPLVGVLFALRIVDKWEPEPLGLKVFAVAWGAIVSIGVALLVDFAVEIVSVVALRTAGPTDAFSAVIQAPIVEEVGKGIGLLIVLLLAKRAFDGPVDGVVYGALIGAGFAFTENIQYFAISLIEGGFGQDGFLQLGFTFFLRGLLSPFAHVMFTAVTGFAVGIAVRRGSRSGFVMLMWLGGLVVAIGLHALWNLSAVLGSFFTAYFLLQVPLFLLFVFGIIMLRREEARLTRARLGDYAAMGWFTSQEVDMLATGKGRRTALQWAQTLRGDRRPLMKSFISDAAALAAARQRALTGRSGAAIEDERILLERTMSTRAALFAA